MNARSHNTVNAIRWIIVVLPIVTLATLLTSCVSGESEEDILAFLESHWSRPVAPQGEAPASFEAIESRLDAGSCGTCHSDQMRDWSGSQHSMAMSPGLLGQLLDMGADDRESRQACLRCHAPLAEQANELADFVSATLSAQGETTPDSGPQLFRQGMLCAACHVRDYQFYGPPRREDLPPLPSGKRVAHDGWISSGAFQDSRFCASCHQFQPDEGKLNGKLMENTYGEWKASRYAADGKSCQSCHMPDRRHLWRGIHDSATVREGVTIIAGEVFVLSDTLFGSLTLTNSGAGHNLPTYITPRIILEGVQLDSAGNEIEISRRWNWISWEASVNLDEEYQDTRLAPDESLSMDYSEPLDAQAASLRLQVRIEPDAFYTAFYRALLDGGFTDRGSDFIRRALEESISSHFTIFDTLVPIGSL
ncbi:MAG: hypothetical protein IH914_06345 [candidate division Zixibacteria bacterium]|nr:hypothetical protein [candidate division Zixibacteria bacterium]